MLAYGSFAGPIPGIAGWEQGSGAAIPRAPGGLLSPLRRGVEGSLRLMVGSLPMLPAVEDTCC
jgi:hypothetical protein